MTPLALRLSVSHKKVLRLKARCRNSTLSNKERLHLMTHLAIEITTFFKLLTSQVKAMSSPRPRAPDEPSSTS